MGDVITVEFDYALPKGEKAGIWVSPNDAKTSLRYKYDGSEMLEGSGRAKRGFRVTSVGKLTEVSLWVSSDAEQLYSMNIPVSYVFR